MDNNKTEIEEIRIENRVQLTKVYVGSGDDYITISGNDISIFERFSNAGDKLMNVASNMESRISEIKKKHENDSGKSDDLSEISETIEVKKEFSEEATKIMDSVFGEGTTRKFFKDVYDEIPDFLPSEECFVDFWDSLIPVIERLSEHRVKLEKLASKKRMSKYQPQDYKKPGGN